MNETNVTLSSAGVIFQSEMDLIPSASSWSHEVWIFSGGNAACVGTIISSYLILTVASCLYGQTRQNTWTIKTKRGAGPNSALKEEQIRNISRVIYHPGFKESISKNDLAILVLAQDLDTNLNSTAQILPILKTSTSNGSLDESKSTNFSGFLCGGDSQLSAVEISQPQKCPYSSYKSDKLCLLPTDSNSSSKDRNSSETISNCSALLPGSSLICSDEDLGPYLCGIFSFSLDFMGENPKIYTNTTHHLEWIESVSAQAKSKANESQSLPVVPGRADVYNPVPYQLSIQYQENPQRDEWKHICGAVILDKTTAITAASCFDDKMYLANLSRLAVVAGEKRSFVPNNREQISRIQKVIIHPNYNNYKDGNDIAILHVEQLGFFTNDHVAWPSPFPAAILLDMTPLISKRGRTSSEPKLPHSLQTGNATILSPSDCRYYLKRGFWRVNVREGVVCAHNPASHKCHRDSGEPLVIQNYKQGDAIGNLLVGINSFGPSNCYWPNRPGVFTEISHFYDWIQVNRAENPCKENQSPCLFEGCYHDDWKCDAERDCKDGMDELNCPGQTTTPAPSRLSKRDPFMKLYATLNLPHSVMKHESFDLKVKVHNNLGHDVNVWVTVFNKQGKSDIGFVDSREKRNEVGSRYIKADQNLESVAHIVITPMVTGKVPIQVKVMTEDGTAVDQTIYYINVKPDGVRQTRNQLVIFSGPEEVDTNLTRVESFEVKFPEKKVKGATSLRLTVTGDPMGLMLSNLDNLLNLPLVNGAHNMIKLIPNILALQYISTDAMNHVQMAKKNLQKSYTHQLLYQKPDGSFSIYPTDKGSTWLTSYTLRWLVEAQKYIAVDNKAIKDAADFIRNKQQQDGSFVESGHRYHRFICGPTCTNGSNRVALTSYVTLALIKANETSNDDLNLTVAIENGMNFISRESVYQLDDNYITNLVTATLMAGDHPEKTRFFEKMEKEANTNTTQQGVKVKYWDMKNSSVRASDPLAIEMTSYALLAHLWNHGEIDVSAFDIHKWLLVQRNPQGGFISTQDTAMGLTALTEFALKTKENARNEDELQLNIQASSNSSTVKDTEFSVSVAHSNRLVLQELTLPVSTKWVNVAARGNGTALVQLTESWYVPVKTKKEDHSQKDWFNITAKMIPFKNIPTEADLEVCVSSFHSNGVNHSIASVELPSGYEFNPSDFEEDSEFTEKRPRNVQRFELTDGNTKVDVFYNFIPQDPPVCITLTATRKQEVANAKKAAILVYEYANPEVHGIVTYKPHYEANVCQLCESTGACDQEGCLASILV